MHVDMLRACTDTKQAVNLAVLAYNVNPKQQDQAGHHMMAPRQSCCTATDSRNMQLQHVLGVTLIDSPAAAGYSPWPACQTPCDIHTLLTSCCTCHNFKTAS
jgi:hypothetical protein